MPVNVKSRYANTPTYSVVRNDGKIVNVFARRTPLNSVNASIFIVNNTQRIDILSFDAYKDVTKYWAIHDANIQEHPLDTLKSVGRKILIPDTVEVKEYTIG